MHSPCTYLTPTASSSPEIELTSVISVGDNPNNTRDGGNDPNNNGDGRNDPNNNGDGRNDPNNNGGGANVNNNGRGANNPNNNNNNGADNNGNIDHNNPAMKVALKALGISIVVGLAAMIWTITISPEMFVKAVGSEGAHCYCSPDRAVQVEDLVPPSVRNPSLETSSPESKWFNPGKNPNKKWLTRIIKDEQCECRSSFFYPFMVICNVSMSIIWWALLTMTYELPHVTFPVWSTLWAVWMAYCLSTKRLYPGEIWLWRLLQLFYTALLVLLVCLRLFQAEKWKSCARRVKKIVKNAPKSFRAWLETKFGATEEAEARASV